MTDLISTTASATVVVGFVAGVIFKIAISPLTTAINGLQKTVDNLGRELKEERERRQAVELKIIEIEQRGKSNTHRLDRLEEGAFHG